MESKIFITSEVVANKIGANEGKIVLCIDSEKATGNVAKKPKVITINNASDIIKINNRLLLRQIRRWQKNVPLKAGSKMDKLTVPIYTYIMSEWIDKKLLAQNPEQMLEKANMLISQWRHYRNANRDIRDTIIGGCLLIDEFLAHEQPKGDTYRSNAALVVWNYIENLIIDYANGTPYIKEILWAKKGSGISANLSDVIASLYVFWQAEEAAIDSLNSEIKILKNVVKFPKVK